MFEYVVLPSSWMMIRTDILCKALAEDLHDTYMRSYPIGREELLSNPTLS